MTWFDNSHIRRLCQLTTPTCNLSSWEPRPNVVRNSLQPTIQMIRDMIVDGVPARDLISCELPKDELKLSNFITNRDDFINHEISRNLRHEFASVLHDECKENLRKTKTEHFLDREMPNFHTYHLRRWFQLLNSSWRSGILIQMSTPTCSRHPSSNVLQRPSGRNTVLFFSIGHCVF